MVMYLSGYLVESTELHDVKVILMIYSNHLGRVSHELDCPLGAQTSCPSPILRASCCKLAERGASGCQGVSARGFRLHLLRVWLGFRGYMIKVLLGRREQLGLDEDLGKGEWFSGHGGGFVVKR